jgi:hypothetical protein
MMGGVLARASTRVENKDGGDVALVRGVEDRGRALSLEKQIEKHLGIKSER